MEQVEEQGYKQINAWTQQEEISLLFNKKKECTLKKKGLTGELKLQGSNNKKKQYIIEEGSIVPPLIDMGVMTPDGKVKQQMYSKFKQINKFLEFIETEVNFLGDRDLYKIVDFGCGKSYLTFLIYYYFVELRQKNVQIIGIDLKEKVVEKCNELVKKYQYQNISFYAGDVKDFSVKEKTDMVISLHACDTATDYALFHGTQTLQADTILSVPCCQHEINAQIQTNSSMSIFLEHGIVKERFSSLLTDSIRVKLLYSKGYKAQIMEFIEMEHTAKNMMIRARKSKIPEKNRELAKKEVENICEEFHITQTLQQLYYKNLQKETDTTENL